MSKPATLEPPAVCKDTGLPREIRISNRDQWACSKCLWWHSGEAALPKNVNRKRPARKRSPAPPPIPPAPEADIDIAAMCIGCGRIIGRPVNRGGKDVRIVRHDVRYRPGDTTPYRNDPPDCRGYRLQARSGRAPMVEEVCVLENES